MKQFTSKTQKTGEFGEKICVAYLKEKGFTIIEQNYTQTFGEIDIVAKKDDILHFIEVKSIKMNVSHETNSKDVTRETYNPAENFTQKKYFKVHKTLKHYLKDKKVSHETKWQIDLYLIYIDMFHMKHKLKKIENVVFS
jgi:putative endonuclease